MNDDDFDGVTPDIARAAAKRAAALADERGETRGTEPRHATAKKQTTRGVAATIEGAEPSGVATSTSTSTSESAPAEPAKGVPE